MMAGWNIGVYFLEEDEESNTLTRTMMAIMMIMTVLIAIEAMMAMTVLMAMMEMMATTTLTQFLDNTGVWRLLAAKSRSCQLGSFQIWRYGLVYLKWASKSDWLTVCMTDWLTSWTGYLDWLTSALPLDILTLLGGLKGSMRFRNHVEMESNQHERDINLYWSIVWLHSYEYKWRSNCTDTRMINCVARGYPHMSKKWRFWSKTCFFRALNNFTTS